MEELIEPVLGALCLEDRQMLLCNTPFNFGNVRFFLSRDDPASFFLSNFFRSSGRLGRPSAGRLDPLSAQLIGHQNIEFAFDGEDGVDYGGLSREAYRLVIADVAHSELAFRRLGDRFYPRGLIEPKKPNNMEKKAIASVRDQYLTLGLALGMMLQKVFICDDLFPDAFYYFLMREELPDFQTPETRPEPALLDLAREADPELAAGLLRLLDMSPD